MVEGLIASNQLKGEVHRHFTIRSIDSFSFWPSWRLLGLRRVSIDQWLFVDCWLVMDSRLSSPLRHWSSIHSNLHIYTFTVCSKARYRETPDEVKRGIKFPKPSVGVYCSLCGALTALSYRLAAWSLSWIIEQQSLSNNHNLRLSHHSLSIVRDFLMEWWVDYCYP